jgi:hypothetical protein
MGSRLERLYEHVALRILDIRRLGVDKSTCFLVSVWSKDHRSSFWILLLSS